MPLRRVPAARRLTRFRGRLEQLETRRLLTIFVDDPGDVTDPNDGRTTLREAVNEANVGGMDDAIMFTCAVTQVNLTQGEVNVGSTGHDITIDGMLDCPDKIGSNVTITADDQFRVFNIDDGNAAPQTAGAIFKNLSITGGSAIEGAGILNFENLTLESVDIFGNMATSLGPPATYGGGVSNIGGSLVILNSTIHDNVATNLIPVEQSSFGGGLASRGNGSVVTVRGSTIANNTALGSGGGLFHRGGQLLVETATIADNRAGGVDDVSHRGGGLALYGGGSGGASPLDVTVLASTISGNILVNDADSQTTMPYGGGIYAGGNGNVHLKETTLDGNYVGGNMLNNSPVVARGGGAFFAASSSTGAELYVDIIDTQVVSNSAGADAGGVFARGRAGGVLDLEINNTEFVANTASASGGAIVVNAFGSAQPGQADVLVTDSLFDRNTAQNGTIVNSFSGSLLVERSTIEANTVSGNGGGILNQGSASASPQPVTIVRNSTLAQNSAQFLGGGVMNYGGTLEIFQSTLSGNKALRGAGGYFGSLPNAMQSESVSGGGSNFTVIDRSTITQNTATNGGGGIAIDGMHAANSQIGSTIVAGNDDLSGQAPDVLESVFGGPSIAGNTTFSLIGIADGSFFTPGNPSSGGNFVGTGSNPISPELSPLISFGGGPTQVHVPLVSSVAVDNADPSVTTGTDQTGGQRVINGRMDIGSVEVQPGNCDFDQSGVCDCADVDMLSAEIANGGTNLLFDVDGSGGVNFNDLAQWLVDAGARPEHAATTGGNPFLLGDANLDGVVDGQDFMVWDANKFTDSDAYCDGDFNADGLINGQDFLIWNSNKFQSADSIGGKAVPNAARPVVLWQPVADGPSPAAFNPIPAASEPEKLGRERAAEAYFSLIWDGHAPT